MSRLKKLYQEKVVPSFADKFPNKLAVPRVEKVVVNVGVGKLRANAGYVDQVKKNLTAITGQVPTVRRSRKAISGFKVRIGDEVGLMVTLRGQKMYDFLDKLANITLPRIRDFRGLGIKGFGKSGAFSLGVRENIYFPETSHIGEHIHPVEITIVTNARNAPDGAKLIKELGFPFGPLDKLGVKEK